MTGILWGEGFEHYGTVGDMTDGLWAEISTIGTSFAANAATGQKCLQVGNLARGRRYLGDDYEKVGIALHFKLAALPVNTGHTFSILGLRNSDPDDPDILHLRVTSAGRIQLISGELDTTPDIVTTSKLAVAAGVWNHLEIVADAGTGMAEVRINGKPGIASAAVAALTGLISEFTFGVYDTGTSRLFVQTSFDDIIAQGGADVDFLGLAGCYYLQPNSDGVPQEWELTSGANAYPLVNELVPDDDTSYIFTGEVDAVATLGVEALPLNVVEVLAVIPIARVRKTDTGECDVALGVVSGGVPAEGPEVALTSGYSYQWFVFETDPEDDVAWEPSPMPNITIRRAL